MPKAYNRDPGSSNIPLVESPLFPIISNNLKCQYPDSDWNNKFGYKVGDLFTKGYTILENNLEEKLISGAIEDVSKHIHDSRIKKQPSTYNDNDRCNRVFEAWRWSENVRQIGLYQDVIRLLTLAFQRPVKPFQTISFDYGTGQKAHQDSTHFNTVPNHFVAAAWTALEDMTDENGPLFVVPGSHRERDYDFQDLGFPKQEYGNEFNAYREYEEWIFWVMASKFWSPEPQTIYKGETVVWLANTLHGGMPVKNKDSSRWSQATHYFAEGCDIYYSPMLSDRSHGVFNPKNMASKDFRDPKNFLHLGD